MNPTLYFSHSYEFVPSQKVLVNQSTNFLKALLGNDCVLWFCMFFADLQQLLSSYYSIAQATEETWTYELPDLPERVATVSLGLDGANLLYKEGYRIAMCGTITLYDDEGNRMYTAYSAAAPEYGKETFTYRFSVDIEKIKARFSDATYVGVADGAPDNWTFLDHSTSLQVLDFYHVTEYVAEAAEAIYPGKKNAQ